MPRSFHWLLLTCSMILTIALGGAAAAGQFEQLVAATNSSGGISITVGIEDIDAALALEKDRPGLVQMLVDDPEAVMPLREAIRKAGKAGKISADVIPPSGNLPYAENTVNLMIVSTRKKVLVREFERVLVPEGLALFDRTMFAPGPLAIQAFTIAAGGFDGPTIEPINIGDGWLLARKPWPTDIDNWTHYRHGPDGNPVSTDVVVAPPRHLQWKAGPNNLRSHETDSSFQAAVIAGGRFFYIVDEAPLNTAGDQGLPDKWFLACRDAFNGVLLWKIPMPDWGWRAWKDTWFLDRPGDFPLNLEMRLVAREDGDRLWATIGYQAPISEIDGRTGEILRRFDGTARTREMILEGDQLLLSMATEAKRGSPLALAALDVASGQLVWKTEKTYGGTGTDYHRISRDATDPVTNLATDGKIIAIISGKSIVALDRATGKELWATEIPIPEKGFNASTELWLGALVVRGGKVLFSDRLRLFALDGEDGHLVWERPKAYLGHLWYEWKELFVIDGLVWTWSPEIVKGVGGLISSPEALVGYSLETGEEVRRVPLGGVMKAVHHHRCYPNRATPRFILSSRRGTEYLDLAEGQHTVHNWLRGTCHFGMLPANGLQYVPPHPCRCFYLEKLNGMNVVAPATPGKYAESIDRAVRDEDRLTKGPALDAPVDETADPGDWPTFRADASRSAKAAGSIPRTLDVKWTTKLGGKVSAPTVAAGRVYVALVDQDQVVALDAATGLELWRYHVGGRVDSPPTYHRGSVLFGSADGAVYCLRASDGALRWRFLAAEVDRRVNVFGRLESAGCVHGSVLVVGETVYFAAGRTSHLDGGIILYGLDADSGEILHRRVLTGPEYDVSNLTANDQRVLPQGYLSDIMSTVQEATVNESVDGILMRGYRFADDLSDAKEHPGGLAARAGMLDDSYFRRLHWSYGNPNNYAQQIVIGDTDVFLARMFKKMIFLSPDAQYRPGKDGFQILAQPKNMNGPVRWNVTVPVRVLAMTQAGEKLVVVGLPESMPKDDPYAAYEGRLGGVLMVLDAKTGETLVDERLDAAPTQGGIAVAGGKLFLTLADGSVMGLGTP